MVLVRHATINLGLNFNFEKLVKREPSLWRSFSKVVLKGGENILECLKILLAHLLELLRAVSIGLGLKGVKIARNVAKVGVHACLSNMHPNL